jgi:hypothetical protein
MCNDFSRTWSFANSSSCSSDVIGAQGSIGSTGSSGYSFVALVRLERSTAGRHARNRCPMASARIPLVLDGDFETQEAHRQKTHIAGGSGSELPNGRRESHLGCATGNPDRESSGRWSNCGSACVSCSNIRERELRYVTPVRG